MNFIKKIEKFLGDTASRLGLGLRGKLIAIFLTVKIIPVILTIIIIWNQILVLGDLVRKISVSDSSAALSASAVENIERLTTDTARAVADFLYLRDADILYIAGWDLDNTDREYIRRRFEKFINGRVGRIVEQGEWILDAGGQSWISESDKETHEYENLKKALEIIQETPDYMNQDPNRERTITPEQRVQIYELGFSDQEIEQLLSISENPENNDVKYNAGFRYRLPDRLNYSYLPLYDEITYIDLNGQELVKVHPENSAKVNYPMNRELLDISKKENTYVKAEGYFEYLKDLAPGEIYVSDVIGAYVGSNYIGMYVPDAVAESAEEKGYEIDYDPESQAFAGRENPVGQRFEGIIRWVTPVANAAGEKIGYVSFALNHDHIMEFVSHITPMNERYTELNSAFEGNYAFIWDYKCRSICHPRHHSIVGYNPETGNPEIPWLETSIYESWQESGIENWFDFIYEYDIPEFDYQSRLKNPAPALTQNGLVGLDGRYLNNAPQCTGWMNLTENGGSGSFYIQWSGLYKLTTAAAIPYYTGQYAPSQANNNSMRGFGFVTIGAGIEDFEKPVLSLENELVNVIDEHRDITLMQLAGTTALIIVLLIFIAFWTASSVTQSITKLVKGITRFRTGERQFRFREPVKDEFGELSDAFDEMADSITGSVKSPLIIIGMDYKIIYMNDIALNLAGKTLNEVIGMPYGAESEYPFGTQYCPVSALETERESEVYYDENRNRYIQGSASHFYNKDGGKAGYIITTTDVTDMLLERKKLEEAIAEAEIANKHKNEFLANMSHEIRTPMNAVMGLIDILSKKMEENSVIEHGDIKNYVNMINDSSQHLLRLLNDILDISKIESGKIDLTETTMTLYDVINPVAGIIKQKCEQEHLEFYVYSDDFTHDEFISDSLRIRQVLINLLGNAVKFTPKGGKVSFEIRRVEKKDGRSLIRFSVKDTGIGIEKDMMANIFKPFEQGSKIITREYGGAGLGLSISRHIIRQLGGDIQVNSKSGEGSEFSFALWLKEAETREGTKEMTKSVTDAPSGQFKGRRALLVDDVDMNRMIVAAMLEITGIEMDEARDGHIAVEIFSNSPENYYDIIIMDVQMPHMSGYEATQIIRSLDRRDAKIIPILALTANAFKDDIDNAISSGMNGHIAKPVDMDKLIEAIFKYLIN